MPIVPEGIDVIDDEYGEMCALNWRKGDLEDIDVNVLRILQGILNQNCTYVCMRPKHKTSTAESAKEVVITLPKR